MKRAILIIAGVVVAAVVTLLVVGTRQPRNHAATSEITLAAPIDSVWAVVRDPAALIGTWPELTRAERSEDAAGREFWDQEVDGFEMRFMVTEPGPYWMITSIQAPEDAAFGGSWSYRAEPEGTGTRVRVTEEGWVSNPIFRAMMVLGGTHRSLDGYLGALARHFGEDVAPVHVP